MDFQLALPSGVRDLTLPMGTWTAGGGAKDDLALPGFPRNLLTVRVSPGQVTLEAQAALLMGTLPIPPRTERLWMPGEVLSLGPNVRLRRCERALRRTSSWRERAGETDTWPTRHPTLVCVMGDGLGRTWCLSNRELQLGRANSAHVRLHAPSVSRVHAALVQHHSHWLLIPHHSKNPTRLNGKPVLGAKELLDGDVIEVGAVSLRFQRPYAPNPTVSERGKVERTAVVVRRGFSLSALAERMKRTFRKLRV